MRMIPVLGLFEDDDADLFLFLMTGLILGFLTRRLYHWITRIHRIYYKIIYRLYASCLCWDGKEDILLLYVHGWSMSVYTSC